MSDSEDDDLPAQETVLKLCLLGNGASGKTSIATVLSQNSFTKQYAQTVGLDFFRRREELPGGKVVQLQIWDVGGQQIGGSLLPTYISGSHGILFVYDVTNQQSFDDLEDWMKTAKNVLAASDMVSQTEQLSLDNSANQSNSAKKSTHFALVGNKIDLQHMIAVTPDTHNKFANENAMSSHLVCASRADGIQIMIKKITASILNIKLDKSILEQSQGALAASVIQQKEPQGVPSSAANQRGANSSGDQMGGNANSNTCSIQ